MTGPLISQATLDEIEKVARNRDRLCTHCGQAHNTNGLHACPCMTGLYRIVRLAAQLVTEHAERRGPNPDDPWDADLWIGQAAALLAQIAGTP